ncbi:unnamed protein product [Rhizophagus irregularis]|nr:unnamed protein product [Rhizophagus irregularis]
METQEGENTNEWVNWIEESITKGFYKFYEYKYFSNIQEIGSGEIVHELRLQRDIQFHSNIINFYGITKFEPENHNDQLKKYLLVMEFADSGIVHRDLHSGNILVHQGEEYDVDLAIDIKEGLREETVPGTPENYVNLYTECWDGEPTNRPTIYQYRFKY